MDFALLPPEINSGLMYAGPGSATLMAASAAWDSLAADLQSTASAYNSLVGGLTGGSWQGPAAQAMAAAAAPHVAWLTATAGQAEQASAQAQAAAAAYEAAFVGTVPPPVIAANRALLMALVATNFFGQNTPAIAATQAQYAEMWAQDAATMYGYAGAAAAASQLTPFTPAPAVANPTSALTQAGTVAGATGTTAATDTQAALSQLTTAVPATLSNLATPAATSTTAATTAATDPLTTLLGDLGITATSGDPLSWTLTGPAGDLLTGLSGTNVLNAATPLKMFGTLGGYVHNGFLNDMGWELSQGELVAKSLTPAAAKAAASSLLPNIIANTPAYGGAIGPSLGGGVSAGLGNAGSLGALSVPSSWAGAAPAGAPAATALPLSGEAAAAPEAAPAGSMLGGVPFMGGAGRGIGGPAPRYGFQVSVVPHPPAAG
jgi:PPE-repeat protein